MTPSVSAFTVAWIAALPHERTAGEAMFDEEFSDPPDDFNQTAVDDNSYSWGKIKQHYVVILCLPKGLYGLTSATGVAQSLRAAMPHIRVGLLVGIGAGVSKVKPSSGDSMYIEGDVQLGDVVVSSPSGTIGGVVQLDAVKVREVDGQTVLDRNSMLAMPPTALLTALSTIVAKHELRGSKIPDIIKQAREKNSSMPALYFVDHMQRHCEDNYHFGDGDVERRDIRPEPKIHYGTIASSNQLIKSASHRDQILERLHQENIHPLCFEMEAAGLMNTFPCLVIRGICDYADQYKNDLWQRYAAMTAAAFAKELLGYVQVRQIEQTPELRVVLTELSHSVRNIQSTFNYTQESVQHIGRDSALARIMTWLNAPDPSINYAQAIRARQEDTCSWLFSNSVYLEWENAASGRTIWLHGLTGCGKTVLSAAAINSLSCDMPDNSPCNMRNETVRTERVILYFFFDSRDSNKQTLDGMLRSLVLQLYWLKPDCRAVLDNIMMETNMTSAQSETLTRALLRSTESTGKVFIVLDALDECHDTNDKHSRDQLLSWLALPEVQTFHFLLTSREEQDIVENLNQRIDKSIAVHGAPVDEDISRYIRYTLTHDERMSRWKAIPNVHGIITDALMHKAGSMFQWIVCQMAELRRCNNLLELEAALKRLPETLTETYDRILHNIPKDRIVYAIRILQLLIATPRPLDLEELGDALVTELNRNPPFESGNRFPWLDEIIGYCSSLTKRSESPQQSCAVAAQSSNGERTTWSLQLAHQSVSEYLKSDSMAKDFRHHFCASEVSTAVVQISLAYITAVAPFDPGYIDSWTDQDQPRFHFLDVAVDYWVAHAHLAENSEQALEWIYKIFSTPILFRFWLESYSSDLWPWLKSIFGIPDWCEGFFLEAGPLFTALAFQLPRVFRRLLRDPNLDNVLGQAGYPALVLAAEMGYGKPVQFLLKSGFLPDGTYKLPRTALQAAAYGGSVEIVRLLLKHGANIHSSYLEHGMIPPISCAAVNGHVEVVRLFLSMGVPVQPINLENERWWPLLHAVKGDHVATVQLLIERGASIDKIGMQRSGSALNHACDHRAGRVVKLLLDIGADPNRKEPTSRCFYPIKFALFNQDEEILRVLLERGARVSDEDVQLACYRSSDAMLDLLVRAISAPAFSQESLRCAATYGRHIVLQYMLERCLHPSQDLLHTLLRLSTKVGCESVVQLVLTKITKLPADAIVKASEVGSERIVQMLIDCGADVSVAIKSGKYSTSETALEGAARARNNRIIELLIDKGAPATIRAARAAMARQYSFLEPRYTGQDLELAVSLVTHSLAADPSEVMNAYAFLLATRCGQLEWAQSLLEKGVDVDHEYNSRAEGSFGVASALECAAYHKQDRMVRFLLQKGAKIRGKLLTAAVRGFHENFYLGETLQLTVHKGNKDIIHVLLEIGATDEVEALHEAAAHGLLDIVHLFLYRGTNIFQISPTYGHILNAVCSTYNMDLDSVERDSDRIKGFVKLLQVMVDRGAYIESYILRHVLHWFEKLTSDPEYPVSQAGQNIVRTHIQSLKFRHKRQEWICSCDTYKLSNDDEESIESHESYDSDGNSVHGNSIIYVDSVHLETDHNLSWRIPGQFGYNMKVSVEPRVRRQRIDNPDDCRATIADPAP